MSIRLLLDVAANPLRVYPLDGTGRASAFTTIRRAQPGIVGFVPV